MEKKKVILVIFDGWGIAPSGEKDASAIEKATTPFMDEIWKEQPHSQLKADGIAVGLPEGQMGNSEVGHINIGAGRVVYQMLVKINKAIEEGNLHKNEMLLNDFEVAKKQNKKVHIIGLVSDGGIHSHIRHLEALLEIAAEHQVKELFVHAITDGRDTDPKSGIGFLEEIEEHLQETTGKLAGIMGRYYAMDRGKNWKRTAKAYDALVRGTADTSVEAGKWKEALREKYENLETDEFIDPIVLTEGDRPVATINEGDVVICFNYRPDRMRQITQALTQEDFPDVGMHKMDLHFLTMTTYDRNYKNVKVLFEADDMKFTLGEVLSSQGKKQIRIAESIKYPHVTYFFNGGREEPFEGEERIMVDTVDVSTFDKAPQMSAMDIRDAIIPKLQEGYVDFVCLNFANADMVGHSGDIEATIKACETVDSCVAAIAKVALENDYAMIIIADHGNAEKMKNANGSPFTAHTTNPVPCILLRNGEKLELNDGQLADIAPTVLSLMGIDIPDEMSGQVIVNSSKK
tara:strand:- start:10992 stop:12542 length:1551 start_codon:yes stop_codon:yes gene_type:complete